MVGVAGIRPFVVSFIVVKGIEDLSRFSLVCRFACVADCRHSCGLGLKKRCGRSADGWEGGANSARTVRMWRICTSPVSPKLYTVGYGESEASGNQRDFPARESGPSGPGANRYPALHAAGRMPF